MKAQIIFEGGGTGIMDVSDDARLTKNILVREAGNISAPDGVKLVLSPVIFEYLGMFQELIDMLLDAKLMTYATINCIQRTKKFNDTVVGADPNSHHLQGAAMDLDIRSGFTVKVDELTRKVIASMWKSVCKRHGRIGYVIFYTNGFHFDCIGGYEWKIYDYRGMKGKDW